MREVTWDRKGLFRTLSSRPPTERTNQPNQYTSRTMCDGDGEVTSDGRGSEAEQDGYDEGYESEWETGRDDSQPLTLDELINTEDDDGEVSISATFRLKKVGSK